jgi:murein DD-endopeptidase MepM/ murein hydrolase activator NlpD
MALLAPNQRPTAAEAPQAVGTALESMLIKQLISSSGAFKGSGAAGSDTIQNLFADTLADAVAKSGGLGLALPVERELRSLQSATSAAPGAPTAAPGAPTAAAASPTASPATAQTIRATLADPSAHVSSPFGLRVDPINGALKQHEGIDIAAKAGSPILAAGDGIVVAAGARGGYGQAVEIQHGSGVTTLYGHASKLLVHTGEHVTQGQPIATVGETGRATGPHLHFEVREGGHALNPTRALSAYRQRVDATPANTHD